MPIHRSHVLICSGQNCATQNARGIKQRLEDEVIKANLGHDVKILETGCFDLCGQGPVMVVYPEGVYYAKVKPEDIPEIVENHLMHGRIVERLLIAEPTGRQHVDSKPVADKELRVVLRNVGRIDPDNIQDSLLRDGYMGIAKALGVMKPLDVVEEIKKSGLQGRGGAGFSTGRKWEFTYHAKGTPKYVVCNADEGEPGTSKDRLILEGDPHAIIEGMLIAGYAIGSDKGYVYVRGEYELSIRRLQTAIDQAREMGLLGNNVLGSDFSFDLEVRSGAGAYVCGEETALLNSIEGKRGEPRYKPPFPANEGLWGKPTLINNVETLANIAPIISKGADWFRGIGTQDCPGTKVFTLSGNVNNRGLIEVPMGITLREVVYEIGGGIPNKREFKLAQTGGTSGGIITSKMLDIPMDITSLSKVGTSLGSGALLIVDDSHCIVDLSLNFLRFFAHESCGKCTPCREGTYVLLKIVERIAAGKGSRRDLEDVHRISRTLQNASLCGLGQTVPIPVITGMQHFTEEYLAHIDGLGCPLSVC